MDTERLGRVLGFGARHAAKTLVGAVDAATAPSPKAGTGAPQAGTGAQAGSVAQAGSAVPGSTGFPAARGPGAAAGSARGPVAARRTAMPRGATPPSAPAGRRGLVEGGRRFGRAVWEPTLRLSGVLWLEVTGLFFGIFVAVAAMAAWRLRGALHRGSTVAPSGMPGQAQAHTEFLIAIGMLLLFGYFAVSSFLAAGRRSRRR